MFFYATNSRDAREQGTGRLIWHNAERWDQPQSTIPRASMAKVSYWG
jgi:hypothetical protein